MPALIATLGLNAQGYAQELKAAEALAKTSGARIAANINVGWGTHNGAGGGVGGGGHGGGGLPSSTAMREIFTIFRELGRGNFSRIPGSLSILLTQFNLLKYILTPLVGILSAVGVAAGFIAYHFYDLSKRLENTHDSLNTFRISLSAAADAMQKAKEKAEDYAEALKRLREPEDTTVKTIEKKIAAMHKEYEARQKLAKENGQTPAQAHAAAFQEAQAEYNVASVAAQEAADALKDAKRESDYAVNKASAANEGDAGKLETLEKKKREAGEIADAVQKAYEKKRKSALTTTGEAFNYEVGGVKGKASVDEAKNALADWTKRLGDAKETEKKNGNDMRDADEKERKAKENAARLGEMAASKQEDLIDAQNAPLEKEKAQEREKSRLLRGNVNSLQAVGLGFALPGQVEMLDVAKKSEKHLSKIEKNTDPARMSPQRGVRF